jgi:hypothetical protein
MRYVLLLLIGLATPAAAKTVTCREDYWHNVRCTDGTYCRRDYWGGLHCRFNGRS